MGVLDNVSDLYKLQKEAKVMKKKLDEQKIVGESRNKKVKLYMNASQSFESIFINEDWFANVSVDDFKKTFKEAFKDYQKKLQKIMMSSFDMSKIKNMLGK